MLGCPDVHHSTSLRSLGQVLSLAKHRVRMCSAPASSASRVNISLRSNPIVKMTIAFLDALDLTSRLGSPWNTLGTTRSMDDQETMSGFPQSEAPTRPSRVAVAAHTRPIRNTNKPRARGASAMNETSPSRLSDSAGGSRRSRHQCSALISAITTTLNQKTDRAPHHQHAPSRGPIR